MHSVLRINLIFLDITNTCADILMLIFGFVITIVFYFSKKNLLSL